MDRSDRPRLRSPGADPQACIRTDNHPGRNGNRRPCIPICRPQDLKTREALSDSLWASLPECKPQVADDAQWLLGCGHCVISCCQSKLVKPRNHTRRNSRTPDVSLRTKVGLFCFPLHRCTIPSDHSETKGVEETAVALRLLIANLSVSFMTQFHRRGSRATGLRRRGGWHGWETTNRTHRAFSSFTSRANPCSRAVLFAGLVSVGSSPARMNPWPAPS